MMDLYISGEFTDYLEHAAESGMLHALRLILADRSIRDFQPIWNALMNSNWNVLMEITLDEIREGDFSREWAREYADGYPRLRRLLKKQEELDLWELEQQTIELLRGYI